MFENYKKKFLINFSKQFSNFFLNFCLKLYRFKRARYPQCVGLKQSELIKQVTDYIKGKSSYDLYRSKPWKVQTDSNSALDFKLVGYIGRLQNYIM